MTEWRLSTKVMLRPTHLPVGKMAEPARSSTVLIANSMSRTHTSSEAPEHGDDPAKSFCDLSRSSWIRSLGGASALRMSL